MAALAAPAKPQPTKSRTGAPALSPRSQVKISDVAQRYGIASYSSHGKQISLRGTALALNMQGDSRRATFNGVAIWLNAAPQRTWGRWTMQQSDVDKTLAPLLQPAQAVKGQGHRTVVLDAGHGGSDQGAARSGICEKHITLSLALAVRKMLQQRGVETHLTRNGDRSMSLADRCAYARRNQADVFVSIHLNSAVSSKAAGIETHILPPAGQPITASPAARAADAIAYNGNKHDGANLLLGYMLQKSLLKYSGAEDRGVRRSRFYVGKYASCPAALVECGFVSNPREAKRLLTAEYQDKIAQALAEGILAYLNTVKRAKSAPLKKGK